MKHLVVRVTLVPDDKDKCDVVIVEKPPGNYTEFSARGMSHASHHTGVFRFKDVYLIRNSWSQSGYSYDRDISDRSYPKFHNFVIGPGDSFTMPSSVWPRIKEAIEAYNEWGAKQ